MSMSRVLSATVLVASAGVAQAATTVYTTAASFQALLLPGAYTETFTQPGVDSGPLFSYSGGGFGYDVTASPGDVYRSGSIIGNNTPNETMTLTFTTGNVTAVGGNFFITNISDVFQPVGVTLALNDGTSVTYTPTGVGTFRGFISTVPILSLTMDAPTGGQFYNSLDNLTVGSAVPEPTTYLMMALGLGGMLLMRRARRDI
jgi:PEP-CTERM motif